jgi:S1-C subfamily serine protease
MGMTAVEGERTTGSPIDDPTTSEVIDDAARPSPTQEPAPEVDDAPRPVEEPVLTQVRDVSASSPDRPEASDDPAASHPAAGPLSPEAGAAPHHTDPVAPQARARSRRPRLLAAAAVLLVFGAVLGGVAGGLLVLHLRPPLPAPATPAPSADLTEAAGAVLPAVLRIQAGAPDTGTAGTAVVLTPTGDVVTNEHLVHGETTATLIAADGRRSVARVVASDEKADVAWLRIDGATNLPVARLAGPGGVRLGDDVVAIGNALNLDGAPSITRGVVSAVGRSTATLDGVIQTDAAISSGSSGGALVDRSGAVVGITTEALVGDPSVSVEDIAFAIPSDRVTAVLAGMGLVLPATR